MTPQQHRGNFVSLLSIHAVLAGSAAHFAKASSSLIGGYSSLKTLGEHIKTHFQCNMSPTLLSMHSVMSTNGSHVTHLSAEAFPVPTSITAGKMNCGVNPAGIIFPNQTFQTAHHRTAKLFHTCHQGSLIIPRII